MQKSEKVLCSQVVRRLCISNGSIPHRRLGSRQAS